MNMQTMFIWLSFFRISKRSPFLVKSAIFSYSCAHCARVDLFIVAITFFLLILTHACLVTCSCMPITKLFLCRFSRCHLISFQCYISKQSKLQFVSMSWYGIWEYHPLDDSPRAHIDLVLVDAKVHANFLVYFPFVDICRLTISVFFLYMYIGVGHVWSNGTGHHIGQGASFVR